MTIVNEVITLVPEVGRAGLAETMSLMIYRLDDHAVLDNVHMRVQLQ